MIEIKLSILSAFASGSHLMGIILIHLMIYFYIYRLFIHLGVKWQNVLRIPVSSEYNDPGFVTYSPPLKLHQITLI